MDDPADFDCVWLATDDRGAVAAMITAGGGPIPASALSSAIGVTEIEGALLNLPEIGGVAVLHGVGDPSSFISLSRRGVFVYDWTDVYRTSRLIGAYELITKPQVPISFSELPIALRGVAMPFAKGTLIGASSINVS